MPRLLFKLFVFLSCTALPAYAASVCSDVGYLAAKCTNKNGQISSFFLRPGSECACSLSGLMVPIPQWLYNSVKGAASVACTSDLVLAPASTKTTISKNGVQLYQFQRCDTNPVTGDPHLVGFDGSKFEFNGFAGGHFNLLTERYHQLNVLLDDFGVADATFIREVGFMFGDRLKMVVKAELDKTQPPVQALTTVEVNGAKVATARMNTSTVVEVGGASKATITIITADGGSDMVQVATETLEIAIERQAGALHLDLGVRVLTPASLHGVLGQTMHWTKSSRFQGDESDYMVSSLFASDSKYNLFEASTPKARNSRAVLGLAKPVTGLAHWRTRYQA